MLLLCLTPAGILETGYKLWARINHKNLYMWFEFRPLAAQMIKNLPAMQETQVRSLGWEDALEKGMVTHSSILAWKTPWTKEAGGLTVHGVAKSQM